MSDVYGNRCPKSFRQQLPSARAISGDSPTRILFPRIVRSAPGFIAWPCGMLDATDTEGGMC